MRVFITDLNGNIHGGPVREWEGLGNKLRWMREQAGMPQKTLATACGTTQSVISAQEDFAYDKYTLKTLMKTAKTLGYEIDITFRQVERVTGPWHPQAEKH